MQQGPSFFGGAAPAVSSTKRGSKSNGSRSSTEEVVVQAVAPAGAPLRTTAATPEAVVSSMDVLHAPTAASTRSKAPVLPYEYDSDSSAERDAVAASTMSPIILPQQSITAASATTFDHDHWSLWQLPTRLSGGTSSGPSPPPDTNIASVVVPPVQHAAFDSMALRNPGRLGTLQVTASGQRRLVLEDGVVLNIIPGQTPLMVQQAVSISNQVVPLGRVSGVTHLAVPHIPYRADGLSTHSE